jgi:hypothetical protein
MYSETNALRPFVCMTEVLSGSVNRAYEEILPELCGIAFVPALRIFRNLSLCD